MRIFKNFDILSKQISLTINKSDKYSTKLGVVNSFIIFGLIIPVAVLYLMKIFNKDLQTIIIKTGYEIVSPEFKFTDFVPFIIRIEEEYGKNGEYKSIMDFNTNYAKCDKDSNNNLKCSYQKLNLTYCNSSKFPSSYQEYFVKNNFSSAYCIEFDSNPALNGSLVIKGSWTESSIYYIAFALIKCINQLNCITNTTIINDFLSEGNSKYFSYYVFEENLTPENYSHPSQISVKTLYSNIGLNIYKSYYNNLMRVNVLSDIGFVSQYLNYTQLYQNDLSLADVTIYGNSNSNTLINFFVYSNNKLTTVNRYYLKLQDVMTILISIMNTIIMLFKILLYKFIDKDYYDEILDEIINYKTLKSENTNFEHLIHLNLKTKNNQYNENYIDIISQEIKLKTNNNDDLAEKDFNNGIKYKDR